MRQSRKTYDCDWKNECQKFFRVSFLQNRLIQTNLRHILTFNFLRFCAAYSSSIAVLQVGRDKWSHSITEKWKDEWTGNHKIWTRRLSSLISNSPKWWLISNKNDWNTFSFLILGFVLAKSFNDSKPTDRIIQTGLFASEMCKHHSIGWSTISTLGHGSCYHGV